MLLLFMAGALTGQAQAPAWQTAVAFGSGGASDPNRYNVLATVGDGGGNLFVAGQFRGTVSFGPTTLTSVDANSGDIFLAKWNGSTNTFQYAQRIGQASATSATGSAIENVSLALSGRNVYIAGSFFGAITFGAAGGVATTSSGSYVARLTDANTAGSFAWVRTVSNTGSSDSSIGTLAANGTNVYLGGSFSGSVGFGGTPLTSTGPAGTRDAFVAKLTDVGAPSFAWALRGGGTGYDEVLSLIANGTLLYAVGTFENTALFGAATLASAGQRDVVVAQVTDAGATASFTAAQRAGGVGTDRVYGNSLAVGPAGVYLAGSYDTTPLTFGSLAVPAGASSSILARWNPATGAFAWVQAAPVGAGASAGTLSFGPLASNGSSIYIAGSFSGTVALGGGTTLTSSSPVAGDPNLWVGKFTDTGTGIVAAWAKQAGGNFPEYVRSLALSGTTVYVQGSTGSAALDFSPLTLTNPYYNGQYGSGGFLATLTDATLTGTRPVSAGAPLPLYPNPAHDRATVRRPAGPAHTLTLTDALGREVRRYPVLADAAETTLDLRGLPAGLYVLRGAAGRQQLAVE